MGHKGVPYIFEEICNLQGVPTFFSNYFICKGQITGHPFIKKKI